MIYDGFIFRDEIDLIEMRLEYLNDYVDVFIIVESNKTFSNQDKPYYFEQNLQRFEKWKHKIRYIQMSPDTDGLDFSKKDENFNPNSAAWQIEYQQRNAIALGLHDLNDEDLVIVSDLDEFPDPKELTKGHSDVSFRMPVYYYYVNMKAARGFGESILTTRMCNGKLFKEKYSSSPQEMRNTRSSVPILNSGWHFSFLGGKETIKKKIKSFSHTEYNSERYYSDENIDKSLDVGKDIFDRGIVYELVDPKQDLPSDLYNVVSRYDGFIKK
jgi:beta-1,4-mannosyl-glycoprotein beta-1,4-N-acetylglucosaminyltransferase